MDTLPKLLALLVLLLAGYVSLPDPPGFYPNVRHPNPPLVGALAPNTHLIDHCTPQLTGQLIAPEKLQRDPSSGSVHVGLLDGRFIRIAGDGKSFAEVGRVPGKCNGWDFDGKGNAILADPINRNFFKLNLQSSKLTPLIPAGTPNATFGFANDVAVSRTTGIVYLSESSNTIPYEHGRTHVLALMSPQDGRLTSFDPATGKFKVLLSDLDYGNGIALTPDESAILIAETSAYRIRKYFLTGPRAGSWEYFAQGLPGAPDNITPAKGGGYWVALFVNRSPAADFLATHPKLRFLVSFAPLSLIAKPYGLIARLDESGQVQRTLHDPTGKKVRSVTSATEIDGELYVGNTEFDHFWRCKI